MKEELVTDALLREFLLARLDDEQRERIESLFLTDSQMSERLLALEQDLIEEYLEGSLSREERETFVSLYAQTEEQRRQLKITQSIRDWAVAEASVPRAVATAPRVNAATGSLWSRLRLRPVFVVPIAAMILIAIVLGIVWLRERQRHFAIEQELAQLNSPESLREIPPQMISQKINAGTVRSVEQLTEITPGSDIQIVELQLVWIQNQNYSRYEAEVSRLGDNKSYTIHNLQADNNDGGVIRVRLSRRILGPGNYRILLRGIANDGASSATEEYSFTVSG